MVNFATTMACVIVISYSVEKPKRNQSVKQRNVLAFRDSGFWRIRVNLPPPCPQLLLQGVPDINATASRGINASAGRGINVSASRGINASATRGINALASRGINASASRGINASATRGINASAGRHI